MTKITKSGIQFKVNIPLEIIDLKGWNENTNILFMPFIESPKSEIDKNTPIIIKEIIKKGKKR